MTGVQTCALPICHTTAPTSAGVGAATTSTVVVASVSILIFDYFITALWGV